MKKDLIKGLAKATREIYSKYTIEEIIAMVWYDEGLMEKYICATEVKDILDEYDVEVEDYMHFLYDNDIMWDTIRDEVYAYDGK